MMGALNLPLSDIVIKILDNGLETFNALLVGHQDFDCRVDRMYSASIVSEGNMPPPTQDNSETITDGSDQMITITFDYATGAISKADPFAKSTLLPSQVDDKESGVILYMVEAEFEALIKVRHWTYHFLFDILSYHLPKK
jgi:hypothetical protein